MLFDEKINSNYYFFEKCFPIFEQSWGKYFVICTSKNTFFNFYSIFNKNLHGQNPYCG